MDKGNRISVTVRPNSGKSALYFDKSSKNYTALVKASPEKGKANKELLKLLKKKFGKKAVIASGAKSRKKIIELF